MGNGNHSFSHKSYALLSEKLYLTCACQFSIIKQNAKTPWNGLNDSTFVKGQ